MKYCKSLIRALVLGASAGVLSLVLDQSLAWLTLGYPLPWSMKYVAWYAITGLVFSAALHTIWWRSPAEKIVAGVLALLYVPSLIERVFGALSFQVSTAVALLASLAIVIAYFVWIAMLTRIIGPVHRSWALVLGALTAAIGLAINRNIVDYPLETAALVLDATVAILILAAAVGLRRYGPGKTALVVGAATVVLVGVLTLMDWKSMRSQPQPNSASGRNLVLIIIDTIRQDVFDSVVNETPEGGQFRASLHDAGWFSNAVAAAPWTAPSVGSIMTGLYPGEHGFGRRTKEPSRPLQRLSESVPTLAEHLKSDGYNTVGIVTNSLLHPVSGISRGFSHYQLLQGGTEKLPLLTVAVRVGLLRQELYQPAESVRRYLRRRLDLVNDSDRPVFLWLHLMDPHAPLNEHPDLPVEIGSEDLPALDRLYRDEVRYVLSATARLIELIKSTLDWNNTVVLVVGDHGEMFPSDNHGPAVKTFDGGSTLHGHGHALYEELIHVPLVIRPSAGIEGGRNSEAMVSHVDLMMTLLDLLGQGELSVPEDRFSYASHLGPVMSHSHANVRTESFSGATQHGPLQFAFRSRDFKLIFYPNGERATEAYNLQMDPGEQICLGETESPLFDYAFSRISAHSKAMANMERADAIDFDGDTRQRLEALGYLNAN